MKVFIALLLVMCATWRMTEGYVYGGGLMFESTWYGPEGNERVVTTPYCEWEGQKMMIGSSWKTTRCEECDCSDYGLECRGHGVYRFPDYCMKLIDETCQDNLQPRQDNLQPRQDNLQRRQDNLRPRQDNLRPRQDNLQPRQDNLQPRQDNLQPRQDNLQPRRDNLQPRQDNIQLRQDNLQPRQDNLQPRQDNLRPRQDNLRPRQICRQPHLVHLVDTPAILK
ncbi:hypothetical protein Bbelb_085220 [Branchiostoma belcheri]|nr:hypothetical protein Bbelb_085220 [Branchiostoma belcheri]